MIKEPDLHARAQLVLYVDYNNDSTQLPPTLLPAAPAAEMGG